MSLHPTIFISAVSKELHSARQLVANTLTFLGYEPVLQEILGTEAGDLREMLRQQIDQCEGVVQLVGQCWGAQPRAPDEEFGRVSYTQYEALYARKRKKKVWYLILDETFPTDTYEPEPEDLQQLQNSYRNTLNAGTQLYYPVASHEALEAGVLKLRDELTPLRHGARQFAYGVAGLLCVVAGLAIWLVYGQGETQKAVTAISAQIAEERESLEKIAQRFASLASTGRLITAATTPEEHYHNARVHELGGNFTAARTEYAEYLAANLEALDPWLSYSAMLKAAEGRVGAIATVRKIGDKLTPRTVSYQTVLALLEEGGARLRNLQTLAVNHPDFGPLAWLVSQEFSEARRGDQTLADQRAEKQWLEKFRALQAAGQFLKYFLDKKEAQQWLDASDARWAKLSSLPDKVRESPVTVTARFYADWTVTFALTDHRAKELFYRLDGKGDFLSSGHSTDFNAHTGLPMVNALVALPNLELGEHTIEVKYLDTNDKLNGPYTLKFSTSEALLAQSKFELSMTPGYWLSFTDVGGKVKLNFGLLMSYRPALKEIRYSLNSDKLDQTFRFTPSDLLRDYRNQEPYLDIPNDSRFASVQVTYKDGTISPVQKILRAK